MPDDSKTLTAEERAALRGCVTALGVREVARIAGVSRSAIDTLCKGSTRTAGLASVVRDRLPALSDRVWMLLGRKADV